MSASTYIVLKNLNDANKSDAQKNSDIQPYIEANASATSINLIKLEMGFNDFLLLILVMLLVNVGFKLLEKILDWIIELPHKEKNETTTKDTL